MQNSKLIFLSLFVFFAGCSNHNEWVSRPLDDSLEWVDIPHCTLREKLVPTYLAQLRDTHYIETKEKISSLCESIPEIPQGAKAYISRALYINKYTGDYFVKSSQNSIWVDHNSLASTPIKITKSVIVVFSQFRPDTLYVTAYSAE